MRARVVKLLARPRVAAASQSLARHAVPSLLRSAACCAPSSSISLPALSQPTSRRFSSGTEETDVLDENRFMDLADTTLHDILNWLDGVEEMLEDSDISLAQGVLKIDLGDDGTWVINRQIPNRQIWWSSPISGPRRYEYDDARREWLNTRDGTELVQLLRKEISEATGVEIFE